MNHGDGCACERCRFVAALAGDRDDGQSLPPRPLGIAPPAAEDADH